MYIKLTMWDQPQKLKVEFELQYQEPAANEQTIAYNMFMKEKYNIIANIEKIVNEYLGTDNALNIITPKTFYVKKTGCKDRTIDIICDNKEDPNQTIIITIRNEQVSKVERK